MTPIRNYNDPWHGAVHAHRAAPCMPDGAPRGWLDGPLTPRRQKAGSTAAPAAAAAGGAPATKPA